MLWYPRKVVFMKKSAKYVVCDRGNERSRMQMFSANGAFIKKIAIRYIDIVAGLAFSREGKLLGHLKTSGDLLRSTFVCRP